MSRKMVIPGESIAEEGESEDTDGSDSVESYPDIATIGDIGESSDISSPGILSPDTSGIPPSSLHTRFSRKAKNTKDIEPFYKGDEVVFLPGDINGHTKKLHLLAAEFFAGNTTVRNELFHVLDALHRLKQVTRKEYADITAHLAASLWLYTRVDVW